MEINALADNLKKHIGDWIEIRYAHCTEYQRIMEVLPGSNDKHIIIKGCHIGIYKRNNIDFRYISDFNYCAKFNENAYKSCKFISHADMKMIYNDYFSRKNLTPDEYMGNTAHSNFIFQKTETKHNIGVMQKHIVYLKQQLTQFGRNTALESELHHFRQLLKDTERYLISLNQNIKKSQKTFGIGWAALKRCRQLELMMLVN